MRYLSLALFVCLFACNGARDESPDADADVLEPDMSTVDADMAGITFATATLSAVAHYVSESGETSTAIVTLSPPPPHEVRISFNPLTQNQITLTPSELVFEAGATSATLTIGAVDDDVSEGVSLVRVRNTLTLSQEYRLTNLPELLVTVEDNEPPEVGLIPEILDVEEGETATFAVRLLAPPVEPVTMTLRASDPERLTLDQETLVFTDVTFAQSRVVTVEALDDDIDELVLEYEVLLTAEGAGLDDVPLPSVQVRVRDDGSDCVPPAQPGVGFIEVAAGRDHTCAIRTSGIVACWGLDTDGQASPRCGRYDKIATGPNYTCALGADRRVQCWGADIEATNPPDVVLRTLSAGLLHACGLDFDGTAHCWGVDDGRLDAPDESYVDIVAAGDQTCAIRSDGTVDCWGTSLFGAGLPPAGIDDFVMLTGGREMTCGLRSGGTAVCWGRDTAGQSSPPAFDFSFIDSGLRNHTCGIRTFGELACWGDDNAMQSQPPAGQFMRVSAGESHTCAIDQDRNLLCWGDTEFGKTDVPE